MSEFVAKIVANLDITNVETSLKKIQNTKIVLQNATIDKINLSSGATSSIAAQVQQALNSQSYSIKINDIGVSGQTGNGSAAGIGSKIGASISDAANKRIKLKLDTGSYDAQIAKLNSKFKKLNLDPNTEQFDAIKSDLTEIGDLLDKVKGSSNSDLSSAADSLEKKIASVKNGIEAASAEASTFVPAFKLEQFEQKINNWASNNSKAIKQFGSELESLKKDFSDLGSEVTPNQFKEFNARLSQIDNAANMAGVKGKTFGDSIKDAWSGLGNYVSATAIVYKAVEGLKQMYQAVYEVDTAMVNLKKVTDETDSTYEAFLKRSSSSAQDLGRSVSSLVEQTADWAKLGYSLPDAEELAKISSIYANVGEVDDATAVSDLVTAMKAFNLEASDALGIVDSLNILGKRIARRLLYRLKDGDI